MALLAAGAEAEIVVEVMVVANINSNYINMLGIRSGQNSGHPHGGLDAHPLAKTLGEYCNGNS